MHYFLTIDKLPLNKCAVCALFLIKRERTKRNNEKKSDQSFNPTPYDRSLIRVQKNEFMNISDVSQYFPVVL